LRVAQALLCATRMSRISIITPLLVTLLSGPALADPVATYRVDFTLQQRSQVLRYTVFVADHNCGDLTLKSPAKESHFRVCAQPTPDKRVRLEIGRRTRDGQDEASTTAVVVTTSGRTFDVLDTKMTITAVP
jgi:hypothetical protein